MKSLHYQPNNPAQIIFGLIVRISLKAYRGSLKNILQSKSYSNLVRTAVLFVSIPFFLSGCDDLFENDISGMNVLSLSPSSGWNTDDPLVTFNWAAVKGATQYNLQIASPSFATGYALKKDTTLSGTKLKVNLLPGQYQWRVSGKNNSYSTSYSVADLTVRPQADISQITPSIIEPIQEQILLQLPVKFKWEPVLNAQYYVIRIKKGNWTSGSLLDQRVNATSISLPLADGSYSWGVSAVDTIHHKSTDFTVSTFIVDKDPPIASILLAPTDKDTIKVNNVQFKWSKPENNLNYTIELFHDISLTIPLQSFQTTDTLKLINLLSNGVYYWRVRSGDRNNGLSTSSAISSFWLSVSRITDLSSASVLLQAPYASSVLTTNSVSFWWDAIDGTDSYQFQLVKPDFTQPEALITDTVIKTNKITRQLPAGKYEWRVRAKNSGSVSAYSKSDFSVYASNISAALVNLIMPEDGTYINSSNVRFEWEPISGARYQFILKRGGWANGTEIQRSNIETSNLQISLPEGEYSWGVKAVDLINGAESQVSSRGLVVDKTPPAIPRIISPANFSTVSPIPVTFQWAPQDASDKDLTYTINIFRQNGLNNDLILHQNVLTTQLDVELKENGTYLWQVNALDKAKNQSAFSSLNQMTLIQTDLTGKAITPKAPFDGYMTAPAEITFWWDAVFGADSYEFQLVKPNFTMTESLIKEAVVNDNKISVQLPVGTYQWRVRAVNSFSKSLYSPVQTLTIKL